MVNQNTIEKIGSYGMILLLGTLALGVICCFSSVVYLFCNCFG